MARASRESLYETGIFPILWGTLDLAINHEEPENTRPLAAENAKLMSSTAYRNYPARCCARVLRTAINLASTVGQLAVRSTRFSGGLCDGNRRVSCV